MIATGLQAKLWSQTCAYRRAAVLVSTSHMIQHRLFARSTVVMDHGMDSDSSPRVWGAAELAYWRLMERCLGYTCKIEIDLPMSRRARSSSHVRTRYPGRVRVDHLSDCR
jgi:hypothetical protein